jgi:Flp pilus assembly CpaF family ATPase
VVQENDVQERYRAKLRRELGPVVLDALADHAVEDVLLNADGALWIKRAGEGFSKIGTLRASEALSAINTVAACHNTVVNHDVPILETELPLDGSRFEALIPPVVSAPVFAIRVRPRQIYPLSAYAESGVLTNATDPANRGRRRGEAFAALVRGREHIEVLRTSIAHRKNILIVGSTGSGKTTFMNALLGELPMLAPQDRVITIEDTRELQCRVENAVELRATGKVTMLDLLRATMRLKPVRINVGEVRGAEAHALLKSWNTGHPGGFASLHANDCMAGLRRLEALVAEATSAPQHELIGEAVDLVVFIDEASDLPVGRKVRELMLVSGYDAANRNYLTESL